MKTTEIAPLTAPGNDRLVVVGSMDLGSTTRWDLRVLDLSTYEGGVMGKSQKPLRIIVDDRLHWKELDDLLLQGHEVIKTRFIIEGEPADLVLGPECHIMTEQHRKYLPLALAEARKRRYPKEKE